MFALDFGQHQGTRDPIEIWCAACSTGQEPYSIAMLLRERYAPVAACCSILATDLCEAALQRAASGLYRQLEVTVHMRVFAAVIARVWASHGYITPTQLEW